MFERKSILIYDIETDSLDTHLANMKWFGAYSYLHNQNYLLQFPRDKKDIIELLKEHKVLVGFNIKEFDGPIVEANLALEDNIFEYKVIIDLLEISAPKGGKNYGTHRKNRLTLMGYKLKNFTLKKIIEELKLDKDIGTKGDIDYHIFEKDEWTPEEIADIKKYLQQDIDLTKKLFEWYEGQFAPLKKLLPLKAQENFLYLKSSLAVVAYNIICHKAGLEPVFGERTEDAKSYEGGHHIESKHNLVKGNIIEVDFTSAYPHAIMMGNLHSVVNQEEDGWTGDNYYQVEGKYNKKEQGKVEKALKEIFLERLKAKKEKDIPKDKSYKIVINCFSEDTQVMTADGIKKLKDCKVGDLVYSINTQTEEVEFKPIEKMYSQVYNGKMIHFNGKNKDLLVTPEHKILFKAPRTHSKSYGKIERIEAKNVIGRSGRYPVTHPIRGLKDEYIDMKQFRKKGDMFFIKLDNPYENRRTERNLEYKPSTRLYYSIKGYNPKLKGKWFFQRTERDMLIPEFIKTKDLFYLIGIGLSEGTKHKNKNCENYKFVISQHKNKNLKTYTKIKKHLDNISMRYSSSDVRFEISSKFWYEFYSDFFINSFDCHIPEWCWKYDNSLLKYLHEGLYDGDGNKKMYRYSTASERLKDDIIRLNLHLGYRTTVSFEDYITKVNHLVRKIWRIFRTGDGSYKKGRNIIIDNPTNKIICCSVKDNHTVYAGRNNKLSWSGNSFYGASANPIFKSIYNRNSASDCTSIVRTWMKKLAKSLEAGGRYECLYGFTDSIFILIPPQLSKEELMDDIDEYIENAMKYLPFPMDTFKMGIEEEIKMIWFVQKNCYLFVTQKDEIKYKSTLLNTNTPAAVMKLFETYMKPIIINTLSIPFTKKELEDQIKIILEKEPTLGTQEYNVTDLNDYKLKTSIQYQISEKYGKGRHYLIPNRKGIGVGLAKNSKKQAGLRYCTMDEFKEAGLKMSDIELTHLISHLKPFYEKNEVKPGPPQTQQATL